MFNSINIVIPEGNRGLLRRDGCLVELLMPGRHRRWALRAEFDVQLVDITNGISNPSTEEEKLLAADDLTVVDVPPFSIALATRNSVPLAVYGPGRYALWLVEAQIELEIVDLTPLRSTVPVLFWRLASRFIVTVDVAPHERVLVYDDGDTPEILTAGRYALNGVGREITLHRVDMRETELQVMGQEIMTRDKVTLRLTLVLRQRIVDPVAAVNATDNLRDALYTEVQLAARAAVASMTVDELLDSRDALATTLVAVVEARAKSWGVKIARLEIKDIILPGEMKALLNRVIEAEKRAVAQNILRREEVAATRSLANTARLLENNPVLRRLKELEAIREIADQIPNLTVVVTPKELQAQLRLGDQ